MCLAMTVTAVSFLFARRRADVKPETPALLSSLGEFNPFSLKPPAMATYPMTTILGILSEKTRVTIINDSMRARITVDSMTGQRSPLIN